MNSKIYKKGSNFAQLKPFYAILDILDRYRAFSLTIQANGNRRATYQK